MRNIFFNNSSQLRSGWKIAIVFLLVFAGIMCFSLILGIAIAFIQMPKGEDIYLETINNLGINPWFTLGSSIFSNILTIAFPILLWKLLDKRTVGEMGLTNIKTGYKDLVFGLLFGAISITIVCILLLATGSVTMVNKLSSPNISLSLLSGLILFIFVGFGEEILGRGYIMSVLKQTNNTWIILIVSSLIFSLLHGSNPNVTILGLCNIFLVGLLFGYMFLRSGNIWLPIGYHITWNYFQGYIWGFQVSGTDSIGLYQISVVNENIINGGAFGPEGGLSVTAIIIIGFFIVHEYYNKKVSNSIVEEELSLTKYHYNSK